MNRKFASIIMSIGILVSILGSTSPISAESGYVYLTRGGDSLVVVSDYKDYSDVAWETYASTCSFVGLPTNVFGSNYVVTRPYTMTGTPGTKTSDTVTISIRNHVYSQNYYTGYTGKGNTYRLYASLSSSSSSSSGGVTLSYKA